MVQCLLVGVGGAIGAIMRYLMGKIPFHSFGNFPINTFAINCIGAFLIGIFYAIAVKTNNNGSNLILFLATGVCGGFTTFSTFSVETLNLYQSGKMLEAGLYIMFSIVGGVVAVFLGKIIVK